MFKILKDSMRINVNSEMTVDDLIRITHPNWGLVGGVG